MRRAFLGIFVVLAMIGAGSHARAQLYPGDYWRTVVYVPTYDPVRNVDAVIRWRQYVRQERKEIAEDRAKERARIRGLYNTIRQRILEHPEERDVMIGSSLNALMEQLRNPAIDESTFRFAPVSLSTDIVRQIPFKIDSEGISFSMQRLSMAGKSKWTIALQDDRFAYERKVFEHALDQAIEQQIEGKMTLEAIAAVEAAVEGLMQKLDRVIRPSGDKLYIESRDKLRELKKSVLLLKSLKIQRVLGDLDQYSGTTVNDLKLFMQKHKLAFDDAESPDERVIYKKLHPLLVQQREMVQEAVKAPK